MKVALSYDLREDYLALGFKPEETAEFDPPETIDALENALIAAGFETERIGGFRALVPRLLRGDRWDLVFNICEGLYGNGREAVVPALLDEFRIPYVFSEPMVLCLTLHKGMAKKIVRDAGLLTAPFVVIEKIEEIENIDLPYPLFVKPIGEGAGKGIDLNSKILEKKFLAQKCSMVIDNFKQAALVETFLPGKDYTVSILGTGDRARVIGVTNLVMKGGKGEDFFSYENKENLHVEYIPADASAEQECGKLALSCWRVLGCRDAGRIDVRLDARGLPNFIEANPLPELNPEYSEITSAFRHKGHSYNDMIRMIVESALERQEKRRS